MDKPSDADPAEDEQDIDVEKPVTDSELARRAQQAERDRTRDIWPRGQAGS